MSDSTSDNIYKPIYIVAGNRRPASLPASRGLRRLLADGSASATGMGMTTETKQARWRARKLAGSDRFDVYLTKADALRLRQEARASGCRPSVLASKKLAAVLAAPRKPWLADLDS